LSLAEPLGRAIGFARRNAAGAGVEVLVNFLAPLAVYDLAKPRYGDVGGLIASSAPPIVWALAEFVRRRRVDALSILVLSGIALSLLAFLGGGGPKFLQLREKLVTGAIGLVFLASAMIGRPLIYQLARATMVRRQSEEVAELEALRDNPYFRRTMMVMTLVWGFGLVAECAFSSALVFALSVRQFLIVGPIIGYSVSGFLILWTFLYAQRQRRLGARRRAEAAARDAQAQNASRT
jgi:hypothetical protein